MQRISLFQTSRDTFLATCTSRQKAALAQFFSMPNVHYLAILESANGERRKIVPVGPQMDYRKLSDLYGQIIEGMKICSYVDASQPLHEAAPDATLKTNTQASEKNKSRIDELDANIRSLRTKIYSQSEEIRRLKSLYATEKRRSTMQNDLVDELKRQLAEADKVDSGSANNEELVKREKQIQDYENEMISRLNEFMEREAKLDQLEENLINRERRLVRQEHNQSKIQSVI